MGLVLRDLFVRGSQTFLFEAVRPVSLAISSSHFLQVPALLTQKNHSHFCSPGTILSLSISKDEPSTSQQTPFLLSSSQRTAVQFAWHNSRKQQTSSQLPLSQTASVHFACRDFVHPVCHDRTVTKCFSSTTVNPQEETSSQSSVCPIPKVQHLPLQDFISKYYEMELPVIISQTMHFPSLRCISPAVLKEKFGDVEVPVEISRWLSQENRWGDYRDLYRSEVGDRGLEDGLEAFIAHHPMRLEDFIDCFMPAQQGDDMPVLRGYVAQHPVEEIPGLATEVSDPQYALVGGGVYQRNIWLGPGGTTTPLHRDPYHNLLTQVAGSKYIRLYNPALSDALHPFTTSLFLRNTSQVDVEDPDVERRWPGFASLPYWECHLQPGEMLYIPLKWWHYIRAENASLSFSFWWT